VSTTTEPGSTEILFVGARGSAGAGLAPGEELNYGKVADFFGRAKEDVQAEWDATIGSIQQLLSRVSNLGGNFELGQVEIELGFSAEGRLGFIAKAGATASVKLSFARPDH